MRVWRILHILLLCLTAIGSQIGAEAADQPGISPKIVSLATAPEGSRIWLKENHALPLVAMTAVLPAGSAWDPPGKSGTAALAAQLLQAQMAGLSGLHFTTRLRRDDLILSLTVPSSEAGKTLRRLGLALARPRITADALTLARQDLLQAIAIRRQSPQNIADDSLMSLYYGPHPYGHPPGGSTDGLKAIRRRDLTAFTAAHWVRGRIQIAFTGDVTASEAGKLAAFGFGKLAQKPVSKIAPPPFTGAPGLHQMDAPVNVPAAAFALPGLKPHDPGFFAAEVANYILGGSEHSWLMASLRDDHDLSEDARTRLTMRAADGLMVGTLSADKRDMREALSRVRQVLRTFALKGPRSGEFSDAKRFLRDSFPLAFASNAGSAAKMAELMADGWRLAELDGYARHIENLSLGDVQQMAKRLYSSENLTIVVAGPMAKAQHSSNPYRK